MCDSWSAPDPAVALQELGSEGDLVQMDWQLPGDLRSHRQHTLRGTAASQKRLLRKKGATKWPGAPRGPESQADPSGKPITCRACTTNCMKIMRGCNLDWSLAWYHQFCQRYMDPSSDRCTLRQHFRHFWTHFIGFRDRAPTGKETARLICQNMKNPGDSMSCLQFGIGRQGITIEITIPVPNVINSLFHGNMLNVVSSSSALSYLP